jgi:guanylate kinase
MDPIESSLQSGRIPILDKDVQGVRALRDGGLLARVLLVRPPSHDVLEARLRSRGTESEADLLRRLYNSKRELEFMAQNPKYYDEV